MFKKPGKRSLAVASLCIGLWGGLSSPAYAVGDVLETPALESDLAASSLLLDIARAGDRLVAVGEQGHIVYPITAVTAGPRQVSWSRQR